MIDEAADRYEAEAQEMPQEAILGRVIDQMSTRDADCEGEKPTIGGANRLRLERKGVAVPAVGSSDFYEPLGMTVEVPNRPSVDRTCLRDGHDRVVDGKPLCRVFLDHGERVLKPAPDCFVEHDVLQILKL